jgi:hypothetical protein
LDGRLAYPDGRLAYPDGRLAYPDGRLASEAEEEVGEEAFGGVREGEAGDFGGAPDG